MKAEKEMVATYKLTLTEDGAQQLFALVGATGTGEGFLQELWEFLLNEFSTRKYKVGGNGGSGIRIIPIDAGTPTD